jgi:hypothetical protein
VGSGAEAQAFPVRVSHWKQSRDKPA